MTTTTMKRKPSTLPGEDLMMIHVDYGKCIQVVMMCRDEVM